MARTVLLGNREEPVDQFSDERLGRKPRPGIKQSAKVAPRMANIALL
jgi:hypothetical protein